jgi:hypothetical protein
VLDDFFVGRALRAIKAALVGKPSISSPLDRQNVYSVSLLLREPLGLGVIRASFTSCILCKDTKVPSPVANVNYLGCRGSAYSPEAEGSVGLTRRGARTEEVWL